MKIVTFLIFAASLFASDPVAQVDADKLAIVQAQLELSNLNIQILQAQRAAEEKVLKAIATRSKRLGCEIDPATVECIPARDPETGK